MTIYPRKIGFGIRDYTLCLPVTGCVADTARHIAELKEWQYVWHPHGCDLLETDYDTFERQLEAIVAHPNIGSVVFITMTCALTGPARLMEWCDRYGKLGHVFNYHGHRDERDVIGEALEVEIHRPSGQIEQFGQEGIVVGVKCGGTTAESKSKVNPAMGSYCDSLIEQGGTIVMTESWEMIGACDWLAERAVNDSVADTIMGIRSGLMGAYEKRYGKPSPDYTKDFAIERLRKAGTKPIQGVLQLGQRPNTPGLWLLDGPNSDIASLSALAMSGVHYILFATGRGSPLGNALCPVYKWSPREIEIDTSMAEMARHCEWQFIFDNTW